MLNAADLAIGLHAWALNAAGETGTAPAEVHLLPAGEFSGADGRGPWRVDDAAAVVAASVASGRPLAIDYDHATDLAAPQGRPAPAAGWITGLEARADGIWGKVEWTEDGAKAVAAKAYRYLSPVFAYAKNGGAIGKLLRAALTNAPNLDLTALNQRLSIGEAHMTFDPAKLNKLGLKADATADAVLDTALAAIGTATAAQDQVAAALGLKSGAGAGEVMAALNTVLSAAKSPDPAQFVPAEQVKTLQAQLGAIQKERSEEKAKTAVDAAIAAGKLVPALRDWALELHAADPAKLDAFIKDAPVVVAPGSAGPTGQPPGGDANALARQAQELIDAEAKAGRTLSIADAMTRVVAGRK